MRWARVGPAIALVLALVVVGVLAVTGSGPDAGPVAAPEVEPAPTAITSDAPRYGTLAELADASDLVVRGHVASTDRGRTFGDPGGTVVESRLVRLVVDDVLRADTAAPVRPGMAITVEEPGWLEDGSPLVVDGVPPSAAGDEVVWFLAAVPSPALEASDDAPAFVLVGPQGHHRVEHGALVPAAGTDPLAEELAALGPEGLVAAVRALVTSTAP